MVRLTASERLQTVLARGLFALPDRAIRALAGAPIVRDGRVLDPQAQVAIRAASLTGKRMPYERPLADARHELDVSCVQLSVAPKGPDDVSERTFAGRVVRIYRPAGVPRPGPALVFFHGGGFVLGSLDSHDGPCRALAIDTPCVVLSVDYRLAPEHGFPAAVDDAAAVFRAIAADAPSLGLDPARIAIGGDSAGGNITAVLALDTRHDAVRPCFQLLIYPGVDQTLSFPSMQRLADGFLLEKQSIEFYRRSYLQGHDPKDPRASPYFAPDLHGLPPALVITAGFDPLRDEGDAYAKRLRDAGVAVTHHTHPSLFHGFWNTTGSLRAARAAFHQAVGVLRDALR